MPEIHPLKRAERQTLAPSAPTAPGAPEMYSRDDRVTRVQAVTAESEARERHVREEFEDVERRYGSSRYLSASRRAETRIRPAPSTPVSREAGIQMHPLGGMPGLISLEAAVIAEEQRKRETWLQEESIRAARLPALLQHEIQVAAYHEQMQEYNRQLAEYNRQLAEYQAAVDAQRRRDEAAKPYGFETEQELLDYVYEMKYTQHLNELGKALTESEIIARAYGRGEIVDPRLQLLEQMRIIQEEQQHLKLSFSIDVGAAPQEYLADVERYIGEVRAARDATIPMQASPGGFRVQIMPGTTFDYSSPPPKEELTGFAKWEAGLAERLDLPGMPRDVAAVQAKFIAATAPTPLGRAYSEGVAGLTYGAWEGVRTKPLTGLASFGIGLLGGAVMKGASALPKLATVTPKALKGVEALWVGSIAGRAAISGISAEPEFRAFDVGETLGGIVTTEAVPVIAGGAVTSRVLMTPGAPGRAGLPSRTVGGTDVARIRLDSDIPSMRADAAKTPLPTRSFGGIEVSRPHIDVAPAKPTTREPLKPGGFVTEIIPARGRPPKPGGPEMITMRPVGADGKPIDAVIRSGRTVELTGEWGEASKGMRFVVEEIYPAKGPEYVKTPDIVESTPKGGTIRYVRPPSPDKPPGTTESSGGSQILVSRSELPQQATALPDYPKMEGLRGPRIRLVEETDVEQGILAFPRITGRDTPQLVGVSPMQVGRTAQEARQRSSIVTTPFLRSVPDVSLTSFTGFDQGIRELPETSIDSITRIIPISDTRLDLGNVPRLRTQEITRLRPPELRPPERPPRPRKPELPELPEEYGFVGLLIPYHYRSAPSPTARLESAYLNLPDIIKEPMIQIRNVGVIQRGRVEGRIDIPTPKVTIYRQWRRKR